MVLKHFLFIINEEFPEINDNLFKEAQNKMKGFLMLCPKFFLNKYLYLN